MDTHSSYSPHHHQPPPPQQQQQQPLQTSAHESSSSQIQPPAAKWIQDNEDSDNDQVGLVPHNRGYKLRKWAVSDSQFGGNKLRAPKTLAEEAEFSKGGKKRTIVKRKKRRLEDGISDEEEDPYTLINIEDILNPIELPTDIVRRPALRRILLSTQIDALAKTSMEFIEGEKNFNKILCRLSAIMHQDDPRYLDLTFDRTVEQRKKYKQDMEAANAAATTLSSAAGAAAAAAATTTTTATKEQGTDVVEALDPKLLDSEVEASIHNNTTTTTKNDKKQEEGGNHMDLDVKDVNLVDENGEIDTEAQEVVKKVKELLLENINYSNEYINRLQGARNKLCKASMQKETLWKELKASAKEEDLRNKASFAAVNNGNNGSNVASGSI